MTLLTKPGLYHQPARPTRRFGRLALGDVPVLCGYTTRGPSNEPVRVESLRQFEAVFGPPLDGTYLHDAVRGFFETGGRTAYAVRVTAAGATAAQAWLANNAEQLSTAQRRNCWEVTAHFPVSALVPDTPDPAIRAWIDGVRRRHGHSIADPGGWANALTVRVRRLSLTRGVAGTDAANKRVFYTKNSAGLAPGCLVGVASAPGTDDPADWKIMLINAVDPLTGRVTLANTLVGFSLGDGHDLHFRTFSFEFEFLIAGQRAELVSDVHLDERHPRAVETLITRRSMYVYLRKPANPDLRIAAQWPAEGDHELTGGSDALENVAQSDWETALRSQADNEEIALVAAPDLVFRPAEQRTVLGVSSREVTCHLPVARPRGRVRGIVVDSGTTKKIAGASVLVSGSGIIATTDGEGAFDISGVPPGIADIRVTALGYVPFEGFVQPSTAQAPQNPAELKLQPLTEIKALSEAAVETLQVMMGQPEVVGLWRVAVIDPPSPGMSPESLLQWQARLFGNQRLFAVAPWIEVAHEGQLGLLSQPPSGHICGTFARGELAQGIHRAPANFPLRHVKSVSISLDNDALTAFHAAGLNAIRTLPGQGIRLMGSRTQSMTAEWRQVSVRRLFDAIEKTLQAQLSWSVFEPNSATTRQIMGFAVAQFLEGLRRRGMFAGNNAAQSYSVKCDADNNIPAAVQRGELLMEIGIAPTRPYEFILFGLAAHADAIEVTEQP